MHVNQTRPYPLTFTPSTIPEVYISRRRTNTVDRDITISRVPIFFLLAPSSARGRACSQKTKRKKEKKAREEESLASPHPYCGPWSYAATLRPQTRPSPDSHHLSLATRTAGQLRGPGRPSLRPGVTEPHGTKGRKNSRANDGGSLRHDKFRYGYFPLTWTASHPSQAQAPMISPPQTSTAATMVSGPGTPRIWRATTATTGQRRNYENATFKTSIIGQTCLDQCYWENHQTKRPVVTATAAS
ncbi:hypothetical protein F5Y03DRAFT_402776 [Xylaria venustula]|nr:hypothetical protein F5Y03DRAFT_402776 [Xylaria venustula]